MADTDLVATGAGRDPARLPTPGPLIVRPAELVALAQGLRFGIVSAGLLVTAIGTAYALGLSLLQPPGDRTTGLILCAVLLVAEIAMLRGRRVVYPALGRHPWLLPCIGFLAGAGAWGMGEHNEQAYYIVTLLVGSLGIATSLPSVTLASVLASLGLALPQLTQGRVSGLAVLAVAIGPLLWLQVEYLTRYLLRLHRPFEGPKPGPPLRVTNLAPYLKRRRAAQPTAVRSLYAGEARLTSAQLQVVLLTAEGLTAVQIADCLPIGVQQARRHLRAARRRAGVATTPALIAWALRHRLIPLHPDHHERTATGREIPPQRQGPGLFPGTGFA